MVLNDCLVIDLSGLSTHSGLAVDKYLICVSDYSNLLVDKINCKSKDSNKTQVNCESGQKI